MALVVALEHEDSGVAPERSPLARLHWPPHRRVQLAHQPLEALEQAEAGEERYPRVFEPPREPVGELLTQVCVVRMVARLHGVLPRLPRFVVIVAMAVRVDAAAKRAKPPLARNVLLAHLLVRLLVPLLRELSRADLHQCVINHSLTGAAVDVLLLAVPLAPPVLPFVPPPLFRLVPSPPPP